MPYALQTCTTTSSADTRLDANAESFSFSSSSLDSSQSVAIRIKKAGFETSFMLCESPGQPIAQGQTR